MLAFYVGSTTRSIEVPKGIKKSFIKIFYTGICVLCFSMWHVMGCFADEVVMKNGDRIQGKVVALTQGKLLFKTTYAGEITITWDQVSKLSIEQPLEVTLKDQKSWKAGLPAPSPVSCGFTPKTVLRPNQSQRARSNPLNGQNPLRDGILQVM